MGIINKKIIQKSIEIFDETKNIFNQISITDYNQFAIDQKDKMETSVKEKGIIKESQEKTENARAEKGKRSGNIKTTASKNCRVRSKKNGI